MWEREEIQEVLPCEAADEVTLISVDCESIPWGCHSERSEESPRRLGIHATSRNGTDWQLSDPLKAYSRTVTWDDGTTTVQGCLERPQLLIEHGRPTYLFAATADGPGGFRNASRTWNMVIPLAHMD